MLYIILCNIKFKRAAYTSNAPINIMPHYSLPGDVREEVGICIIQNSNAPPIGHGMPWPVSQIPTIPPPKTWRFMRRVVC